MSARAGKSLSAADAGWRGGRCRDTPPAPCPSAQPPFNLHPEVAKSAEGRCCGCTCGNFLQGAGAFALQQRDEVPGGASCPPLRLHSRNQSPLPRSALLSWQPWAAPSCLPK